MISFLIGFLLLKYSFSLVKLKVAFCLFKKQLKKIIRLQLIKHIEKGTNENETTTLGKIN